MDALLFCIVFCVLIINLIKNRLFLYKSIICEI